MARTKRVFSDSQLKDMTDHQREDEADWRAKYRAALDGPQTVVCDDCGSMLCGDGPDILIECFLCFRVVKSNARLGIKN